MSFYLLSIHGDQGLRIFVLFMQHFLSCVICRIQVSFWRKVIWKVTMEISLCLHILFFFCTEWIQDIVAWVFFSNKYYFRFVYRKCESGFKCPVFYLLCGFWILFIFSASVDCKVGKEGSDYWYISFILALTLNFCFIRKLYVVCW